METLRSESRNCQTAGHRLNTGMLRQWSSPDVILVVTDFLDEESIQFHAIQQARQSGAKVLLVEVGGDSNATPRTYHLHGAIPGGSSVHNARNVAERMTSHLRSSGI